MVANESPYNYDVNKSEMASKTIQIWLSQFPGNRRYGHTLLSLNGNYHQWTCTAI